MITTDTPDARNAEATNIAIDRLTAELKRYRERSCNGAELANACRVASYLVEPSTP